MGFSRVATRVRGWASHRNADRYLATVSFAESSIFPVPPDLLLAPMCVAQRDRARWLALWTTVWSVLGGLAALLAAAWATEPIVASLERYGFGESLELAYRWFEEWGFAAVVVSGFSPIPYKIFAFGAGAMEMSVLGFVCASLLGRGGRFFLVAELMRSSEGLTDEATGRIRILGWSVAAAFGLFLILT